MLFRKDSRSAAADCMDGRRRANSESITNENLIKIGKYYQKCATPKQQPYVITRITRLKDYFERVPWAQVAKKSRIKIEYAFPDIPVNGIQRDGQDNNQKRLDMDIAQWYPRMAVYDDISGWNTMPYLRGMVNFT